MDSREFLSGVVPWMGDHITIHWRKPGGPSRFHGKSYQSIDEVLTVIRELKTHKDAVDIYFCISAQREGSGKRSRENASYLCCVPFDIDIKLDDPTRYATLDEAVTAVLEFCAKLAIPKPSAWVMSGGGLHVYWFGDRHLTVADWQPFAHALKTAALTHGLKIDPGVTGDAARILRVPDTLNHKYNPPRPVSLLAGNGIKHDFATVFKDLAVQHAAPKARIRVAEAFAHLGPNQSMAGGIMGSLPLPFAPIKAECGWLRHVHDTGGKDQTEPSWRDALRCSIFLEDGKTLIHEFGNAHPDYDSVETESKYDSAYLAKADKDLGYPKCKTISGNGAYEHCKVCPHHDKGKSPLNFGLVAAFEAEDDKEMLELGGTRPPAMRLPKGYCVNEQQQVCSFIPTTIKNNKPVAGRLVLLISNVIRDPNLQMSGDQRGISFIAQADKAHDVEVFLDVNSVYRETGLLKMLPKNCVRYNPSVEAKIMVERFFKSWLDLLAEEDTPIVRDPSMGWKYEVGQRIGFVYCGKMHHGDGNITVIPQGSTEQKFYSFYMPTGSIEPWRRCVKLLVGRKRPELNIILAAAFAGPLTVFAGALYGAFLSVWGEPGTAKSTAQQVGAAMWGHPKQTRESLNSTAKSIQGRLGRTKNLPTWQDDVQEEQHQQKLCEGLFVITEGMEGGRLNPDASYKDRLEWQSFVVLCSNTSFVDYLMRTYKSTTAGVRRVFEFEFNKDPAEAGMINPIEASQAFAELEYNYGCMGAEYVPMLARDHKEIAKLVNNITEGFRQTVEGTSDESYWWGLCGILLAGAVLAGRLDVDLDVEEMKVFLIKAFLRNRRIRTEGGTEGGTQVNTEQAVTAFLNHYLGNGNAIYTTKLFEHRTLAMNVLASPNIGRPVYIHVARDQRTILVSKRAFKKFLDDNDIRSRQVLDGMAKYFKAKERKHTLGAGTANSQAQELCVEFVVPVGPGVFDGVISAHGQPETRPHLVPNASRDPDGA